MGVFVAVDWEEMGGSVAVADWVKRGVSVLVAGARCKGSVFSTDE